MHILSFGDAFHAGRLVKLLTIAALAVPVALECPGATAWAQTAEKRADPAIRPEFREPVTLASKEGVLEVRLTARQGQAALDTAAKPVQNFLLFDYEVIRGTASERAELRRQSLSPRGNADNVLLHIPPGMSNTYTYDIPRNMPQGLYWYHSHLHGLTSAHVYAGLVGLLAIGRTDGNLPLVTEKNIPIRNMALQYNFVFDRAGGLAQLNNLNWPQW